MNLVALLFSLLLSCVAASPCYHASYDSGARVLQVLHTRPDRLSAMRAYLPLVAGQITIRYSGHDSTEWERHDFVDCHHIREYFNPCIGRLVTGLMSPDGLMTDAIGAVCTESIPVSGLMYHHGDFWVSPELLLGSDTGKAWFLTHGLYKPRDRTWLERMARIGTNKKTAPLPTYCGSGDDLSSESRWYWWADSKTKSQEALAVIYNSTDPPKHWERGMVCYMHVDLFFLPVKAFGHFMKFIPHFNDVFQEVGLSTALLMSVREAGVEEHPLSCNGGCCVDMPGSLRENVCGHRINLADNGTVNDMIEIYRRAVGNQSTAFDVNNQALIR